MPKLRINLRDMGDLDEFDLIDEVDQLGLPGERVGERDEGRIINPVAFQRRQDSRKWGKESAKRQRAAGGRLKP